MTVRQAFAAAGLIAALTAASCDSPTTPASPLVGIWTGTMNDARSGAGTLRLRLESGQAGIVSGTWSVTFPERGNNNSGEISSSAPASNLAFTFGCTPSGSGGMVGTLAGNRITGTYFALSCTGVTSGSMDLTKQ